MPKIFRRRNNHLVKTRILDIRQEIMKERFAALQGKGLKLKKGVRLLVPPMSGIAYRQSRDVCDMGNFQSRKQTSCYIVDIASHIAK